MKNRVAIITGASMGIGRATAELFAKKGYKLTLVDLDGEKLEAVKNGIEDSSMLTFAMDIADEEKVNAAVDATISAFGTVDIMVNNAGIWRDFRPFEETDPAMWQRFVNTNIIGTFNFCKAVIPTMKKNSYGRIINVASVAGVYGNANMAVYSGTKGAVIAFTKALAKELTPLGITANAVSPGSVSNSYDAIEPSELAFIGRTGTHTENAKLIDFLASDDAAYISGQNIQIDGCRKKM